MQYVRTSVSNSMAEARPKVIDLYRKSLRLIPYMIAKYELDAKAFGLCQWEVLDYFIANNIQVAIIVPNYQ